MVQAHLSGVRGEGVPITFPAVLPLPSPLVYHAVAVVLLSALSRPVSTLEIC